MAVDYYVRTSGNDTTGTGLSPATAWATLAKALGATGVVAALGDRIIVGPGVYRNQPITCNLTSPTSELKIVGDVEGILTGDTPGEIRITGHDVDDKTIATSTTPIPLNLNGKDFLTFENITWIGGRNATNGLVQATTSVSTDIIFRKCKFVQGSGAGALINYTSAAGVSANWTIEYCIFVGYGSGATIIQITSTVHTSEYNLNFVIQNCRFYGGGTGVNVAFGSASSPGGGIVVKGCSLLWCGRTDTFKTTGTNVGVTFVGITVTGCVVLSNSASFTAAATGQMVEDYNHLTGARTLVTAGTNSKDMSAYSLLMFCGEESYQGKTAKALGTPTADSPMLAFAAVASMPADDAIQRPRPAGGLSNTLTAVGALERHQSGVSGGSANADGASGDCLMLSGPSDHAFTIPVDATSTTISIKFKTSSYVGTNYPRIILSADAELGVATQTVTAGSAATTYTTLTFSAFTPSKKGQVTVRLENRTADGAGIVYWDTWSVV